MCKVEWCDSKPVQSGKGYCRLHYDQIRKYGTTTDYRPIGSRNEYIIHNDYAILYILDINGNIKKEIIVDKDDVDKLKKYSFRYSEGEYVKSVKNNKTIYLHRIVMDYNGDLDIDHINRNKLDNRKCNLRIVSHSINAYNKEHKDNYCITYRKGLNKPFYLKIRQQYIGYFKTLEEAKAVREQYSFI